MDEQYNQYNYNGYDYNQNPIQPPPPPPKPIWAAVTSFVLGLLNICLCCCTTYLFAPLSLIFGIISLVKKWGAKGLAITGVILSSISLIYCITTTVMMYPAYKDMVKFMENAESYIQEYDESGKVPDDFKKYCDPEYDAWWKSMGYDSFEDFFNDYMRGFKDSYNRAKEEVENGRDNSIPDDFFDDAGEKPVDL